MSRPNQNSPLYFFYYAFGDGFADQQAETLLFSIITTKMLKEAGSRTSSEAEGWSLCLETAEMMKRTEGSVISTNGLEVKEKSEGRLLQQTHG